MVRAVYFDCAGGAAGDMILGALVDAGAPLDAVQAQLDLLGLPIALEDATVTRAGVLARKVEVITAPDQGHRTLADIRRIVEASALDAGVASRALAVFVRLARAEGAVHGVDPDAVEFHEVGSLDAIADVAGAMIALDLLGVERCYVSTLPLGGGTVRARHGVLPVPGPAVLALLVEAGLPARPGAAHEGERVTPTGAAILAELASPGRPEMTLVAAGTGAGSSDPPDRPNVLRAWVGDVAAAPPAAKMTLLETNIDDMNPELLPYARDRLLRAGAADAWLTPIAMKKGRAATMLSVLCADALVPTLSRLILEETTTLGMRSRPVDRIVAERELIAFESTLGPAQAKAKLLDGRVVAVAPEFDASRALAERHGLPLQEVYRVVEREAWALLEGGKAPT